MLSMYTLVAALTLVVVPALAGRVPIELVMARAGAHLPHLSNATVLAGAPVNNVKVSPSNVLQCSTATVSWTGVVEPVQLFIAIGGFYVGETPLTTLKGLSGGSTTWQVAQPAGTSLIFQVTDAAGAVGYIQNIEVQASGDVSCLGPAAASASTTSSSAALPSAQPSSPSPPPAGAASPSADWQPASSADVAASAGVASAADNSWSTSGNAGAAMTAASFANAASSRTSVSSASKSSTLTIASPSPTVTTPASVGLAGAQTTQSASVKSSRAGRTTSAIGTAVLLGGAAVLGYAL